MLVKLSQTTCGKLILSLLFSTGLFLAIPGAASAQVSPFESFSTVGSASCGPSDRLTYSVAAPDLTESETIYIKTNAANLTSTIDVYLESDSGCSKIGTVTANDKSWSKLTDVSEKIAGSSGTLILASPNLGADIYASVATILITPPGLCTDVNANCMGDFQGYTGAIEPVTVSVPGEFVTVQTIPDVNQETILYVEYYDGGEFLYTLPEVTDIDQNYLRGGERTVKKVVYLSNNKLFTITEQVQMPSDPLYSQYIKSSFFRLGGQTRLVLGLVGLVAVVLLIAWIIRRIHARRTYRTGHGIDAYLRTHHND